MKKSLKIVILGAEGVGKTSICLRFVHNLFGNKYLPTFEDTYKQNLEIDGNEYHLQILDTQRTEQFLALRDIYTNDSDAFLLIYSITDKASFELLEDLRDQIARVKDGFDFPFLIVASKSDLEDQREVSKNDLIGMEKKWNCSSIQVSAKDSINVFESFQQIIRILEKKEKLCQSKEKQQNCFLF